MTLEQFKEKFVGKAVHCDTEEKAKELLKLAHGFGWEWNGGTSLIEETYWWVSGEESCYQIGDTKTVVGSDVWFYEKTGSKIVKFESEEKQVKKTKKVFDLGLFVDYMKNRKRSNKEIILDIQHWALDCHGLTEKEMSKINKATVETWMKEVEVKVELTEHEIEVLKALKVLNLNWIARDSNDVLYAYGSKPIKNSYSYSTLDNTYYLNKDLFKFVTWQDKEPTSIDELLKNV